MFKWHFLASQRGADADAAPENEDPSRLETLKKQFVVARRGNFCRTRAYDSQIGGDAMGVMHLQALEDPETFRWMLQEVTSQPNFSNENLPAGAPMDRRRTRADGLPFFEALESLAHFEALQESRGNNPVGKTAEELGNSHYKVFAEAEGIVFDLNGRPHPTRKGLIVTDGDFMPGAEESAVAHYKQPLPGRVWTAGALSQLFDQARASKALDGLAMLMTEREQWQRVIDTSKVLHIYLDAWRLHRGHPELTSTSRDDGRYRPYDTVQYFRGFEKHWRDYDAKERRLERNGLRRLIKKTVPEEYEDGSQRRYAFFQTVKDLRRMVPAGLDRDGKCLYEKMCTAYEFYFLLYYSNKMMADLLRMDSEASIKEQRDLIEAGTRRMEKVAAELGYGPERIQSFKAVIYSGEVLPDGPDEIKEFIDACSKKLNEIEKAAESQRVKIAAPRPGY